MRRIVLSSVACRALSYFFTLPNKWHDLRKNVLNKRCVLRVPLQLLSEAVTFLRRAERDIIINVQSIHVKYPLFLLDVHET